MQYDRQDEPTETRVQVIDRLTKELYSVEDRVEALSLFMDSEEITKLSDEEFILMDSALKCLKAYEVVLADKIERLEEQEDNIIYLTHWRE